MPFPRASKALTRFTVLDLTRVRSGPTCVRQLADWGANVIKIETPPGLEEPMGGPREGGDFQNLHRNKRSMTLNLKAPEGLAAFKRMVKKADVVVENFRPDVKKRLGIDYKTLAKINPRIVYASISGFGQDGPYARPAGFRSDRAGHGRADVGDRPAGARPGARRHSGRRSQRRTVGGDRHPGRAVGAREIQKGPAGRDLAAASADLHARLPGRPLSGAGRSRQAGRQQSSDQRADRRLQDRRRLHQHRHRRADHLEAVLRGDRGARAGENAGLHRRRRALEEPRRARRRHQQASGRPHQRANGSSA